MSKSEPRIFDGYYEADTAARLDFTLAQNTTGAVWVRFYMRRPSGVNLEKDITITDAAQGIGFLTFNLATDLEEGENQLCQTRIQFAGAVEETIQEFRMDVKPRVSV